MDRRMRDRVQARDRLAALIGRRASFDVVRAALLVAAEDDAGVDVERDLALVRAIRREAGRRADRLDNPFARLDALRVYLFEELRFRGNHDDADDPGNCLLPEVLARRTGAALPLSILFLEAARSAGFAGRGIDLPGHFVTAVTYDERTILVDPFHGGRVITEDDCRELVGRATGHPSRFRREQLEGASARTMLERLLRDLKRIYLAREEHARALSVVDRLLLVCRDDAQELRDRGFLLAHLGRPVAAVADLENYLTLHPQAPDAASVRGRLAWLRRRMMETE